MLERRTFLILLSALLVLTILPSNVHAQDRDIAALAVSLSQRIVASGKKTIAVTDVGNPQTCVTGLGRYIAEELVVGLLESGSKYGIVNRTQLQKVLSELKLGQSGLTDPASAKQFGRLTGADAIVVGSITFFGDTVRVNVQVLDTETAATVAVAATSIARTAAVDRLNQCLETTAPSAPAPTAARFEGATPAKTAEPVRVKADFENGYIRIFVSSLAVSSASVGVTLTFENISNAPLQLSSTACLRWQMVDSNGTQWRLANSLGLSHQQCGEGGINTGQPINADRFVDLAPSTPTSVVLQFQSFQGRPAAPFTVTGELIGKGSRSGYSTFAVVLPNLRR